MKYLGKIKNFRVFDDESSFPQTPRPISIWNIYSYTKHGFGIFVNKVIVVIKEEDKFAVGLGNNHILDLKEFNEIRGPSKRLKDFKEILDYLDECYRFCKIGDGTLGPSF